MKTLTLLLIILFTFTVTACDGGSTTVYAPASNSITSGTAVASAKPAPTGSQDSPVVEIISYTNAATPGNLLSIKISFTDYDGNVKDVIIAEKGEDKHYVISVNAGGIYDGYIGLDISLSNDLVTGLVIEFDIGLVDDYDKISNYQSISVQLSEDSIYGITAYSGDSPANLSGTWDITRTVTEPNPLVNIGKEINGQITINQYGTNVTLTDETGSYSGTISGNSKFVTIAINSTEDATSQGIDLYADIQNTFSGEIIDDNIIEGKSNTIITKQYGDDINLYRFYSLSGDMAMTRDGSSGGGTDEGGDSFSTATPISIGTIYNKEIDSNTDVDYFVVTTETGGTINVALTNLWADLDLELYDSEQVLLKSSLTGFIHDEEVSFSSVGAETYYIKVIAWEGAISSYDLKVTFAAEYF